MSYRKEMDSNTYVWYVLTFFPKGCLGKLWTRPCKALTIKLNRNVLRSMLLRVPSKSLNSRSFFFSNSAKASVLSDDWQHNTDISLEAKCSRTQNLRAIKNVEQTGHGRKRFLKEFWELCRPTEMRWMSPSLWIRWIWLANEWKALRWSCLWPTLMWCHGAAIYECCQPL